MYLYFDRISTQSFAAVPAFGYATAPTDPKVVYKILCRSTAAWQYKSLMPGVSAGAVIDVAANAIEVMELKDPHAKVQFSSATSVAIEITSYGNNAG